MRPASLRKPRRTSGIDERRRRLPAPSTTAHTARSGPGGSVSCLRVRRRRVGALYGQESIERTAARGGGAAAGPGGVAVPAHRLGRDGGGARPLSRVERVDRGGAHARGPPAGAAGQDWCDGGPISGGQARRPHPQAARAHNHDRDLLPGTAPPSRWSRRSHRSLSMTAAPRTHLAWVDAYRLHPGRG